MGNVDLKRYQTYIFDLDGTLTATGPAWIGIFRDGLADFGITGVGDKIIAQHTHHWNEVIKLGVPAAKIPNFIAAASARANERLPKAPFYDGVIEMLTALRATSKLAVFTGMDRPILEPVIKHRKLHDYFDVIIAGSDVDHRKPHPAGILAALEKLGEPTTDAVYIGDKDTDILCGQNAGTDTILFYPANHQLMYDRDALMASNPTHVIEHWRELM